MPFGETNRVAIDVVVAPEHAHVASVQHTVWMLVNLLCRLDGIVDHVGIVCPDAIPVSGRVVPLAPAASDLRTALCSGAGAIGIVPADLNSVGGRRLVVGPDSRTGTGDLYLLGSGWCGGVSATPIELTPTESALPFGPYIAACLAAGEVFKAARFERESYRPISSAYYSAWSHSASTEFLPAGPASIQPSLAFGLAGVGAVGNALLHALWAVPDISGAALLADNDPEGITTTNLNRYSLFGMSLVGSPKARAAAALLAQCGIAWTPHDTSIEEIPTLPATMISAVDKNQVRHAIQNRYPARLLSGSTHDLRCEVLRCGPPATGACLACFNPPEQLVSTDEKRRQLQQANDSDLLDLSSAAGVSVDEIKEYAATGRCGIAGEQVLAHMRPADQPREFAVGFVSVMAGTLLAAEAVKGNCDQSRDMPLSDSRNRAVFQFWTPSAPTNQAGFIAREDSCAKCAPDTPAAKIWETRYKSL